MACLELLRALLKQACIGLELGCRFGIVDRSGKAPATLRLLAQFADTQTQILRSCVLLIGLFR